MVACCKCKLVLDVRGNVQVGTENLGLKVILNLNVILDLNVIM